MKLSLKIRDDQRHQYPLIRAKVPITVLGLPFMSGVIAGDPSDLSFNLSTKLPSGPSFKLSYSPTTTAATPTTPFTISLKSGVGLFGSPQDSPLILSAHFNLFSNSNPSFSLQIKPQFGNFSFHKTTSSPTLNPRQNAGSQSDAGYGNEFVPEKPTVWRDLTMESSSEKDGFTNINLNPNPRENGGVQSNGGFGFGPDMPLAWRDGGKDGILSGVAVKARTALPVTSRLVVNFRWGLNVPSDIGRKFPFLTVDKIGIERVEDLKEVKKKMKNTDSNVGDVELLKGMCSWMTRDLVALEKENRDLKQSLEELRVVARNCRRENGSVAKNVLTPSVVENSGGFKHWKTKRDSGEENGRREVKKSVNQVSSASVESELQKAIQAASSL